MESFTIFTLALLRKAQLKIVSCLPFRFSVSIVKNYIVIWGNNGTVKMMG